MPVQFSHCYVIEGGGANLISFQRANLIHSLLVFERQIDLRLRWVFSPWRNSDCRRRDVDDLAALKGP